MNRVDRLYLKAIRAKLNSTRVSLLAFVDEVDGRYKATAQIWNGKPGSMSDDNTVISWHDTQDEAVAAINRLAEEYPEREDEMVFIVDYG